MTDHVWLCDAYRRSSLIRGFDNDELPGVDVLEMRRQSKAGVSLPRSYFPTEMHYYKKIEFRGRLPQYFTNGSYMFINRKAADIIRRFDMGGGALFPVALFQYDRVTPIEADIHILCIGNAKDTVVLDQTKGITQPYPREYLFDLPLYLGDEEDEFAVRKDAAAGPDLWADPKMMGGYFFMSNRLAEALISAGMKKAFDLRRTKFASV